MSGFFSLTSKISKYSLASKRARENNYSLKLFSFTSAFSLKVVLIVTRRLFEMSSVKKLFLKIFHLAVAVHYIFAILYDWIYVLPNEIILREYSFGGKLVYLTVLNVVSLFVIKSR